jgi:hypothetical protein
MVLIIGQTDVDLSLRQVRVTADNFLDAGPVHDQSHHVVHSDASALDDRPTTANTGDVDQITIRVVAMSTVY